MSPSITADDDCNHEIKKNEKVFAPWKESYDKLRETIKKQRHLFADRGLYNQSCGFSSSHVQMGELDNKEGYTMKN